MDRPYLSVDSPYNHAFRPTVRALQPGRPLSHTLTKLIAAQPPRAGRGGARQTFIVPPKPPPSTATLIRVAREIIHGRETKFREAFDDVVAGMDYRVQYVIDSLCNVMGDVELKDTLFRKCLKCLKPVVRPAEREKDLAETKACRLDELFCKSCNMQLCDLCWKFATLGQRTEEMYETQFKNDYQCGSYCAKCIRRCWICSRHVKPPLNMNARAKLTVDDRIFNKCRAVTTANAVSRLSDRAYLESTERVYDERKNTLQLFLDLSTKWKNLYLPSSKHKLSTDARYAAAWRILRCATIVPRWLKLVRELDAALKPVINDGRAIVIYRHLESQNLLPAVGNNTAPDADTFPRIPSGHEARTVFAGKRIVVMGDSIGRHIYRDLINLLQGNGPLAMYSDLSFKGDEQYCNDISVHGTHYDVRKHEIKGIDWYEHRIFYGPCQITVEYVWITRVWNRFVENDLKTLFDPAVYRSKYRLQRAPDVVIFNSTLWDLSRYHDTDYSAFAERCDTFAQFWGKIAPTVASISAPIFINYSTPKPGQVVTGDLVADLTNEDYEAARTNENVRQTYGYLYKAMQSQLRNQPAVNNRVGFVDLYAACEKFRLEDYRYADGIHYDPPAVRVFTSMILAEYLRIGEENRWPVSPAPQQSIAKRGVDGRQAVTATAVDSVRHQWLYKCHDSLSAHTMSCYIANTQPAEFALKEFRDNVRKNRNPKAIANVGKLDFFKVTNKVRPLLPCFPIREMPSIAARLYAMLHAMLDDMGRLHLIRHVSTKEHPADGMQTIFPLYEEKSRVVLREINPRCRNGLRDSVTAILDDLDRRPNMVHHGPPNGSFANENYIRCSFLFEMLKKAEYMTPLYRLIRDSSNKMLTESRRQELEKLYGAMDEATFVEYTLKHHLETGVEYYHGHIKTTVPLKDFLSSSAEYTMGSDLAELLYNNALQLTVIQPLPKPLPPPPIAEVVVRRPPREEELQQLLPRSATARPPRPRPTVQPTQTSAPYVKSSRPAPLRPPSAPVPSASSSLTATVRAEKVVPIGFVAPKIKKTKQVIRAATRSTDRVDRARPVFGRAVHVNDEGFVVDRDDDDDDEQSDDDAASLDDDQYEISAILDLRKHRVTTSDSRIEYKIQWTKYPKYTDWWEPIQSLSNCKDLMDAFMAQPQVIQKYERILAKLAKEDEEAAKADEEKATAVPTAEAESANKERSKTKAKEAGFVNEDQRSSRSESSVEVVEPNKKSKSVRFSDFVMGGFSGRLGRKKKSHKSILKKSPDADKKSSKSESKKADGDDDADNAADTDDADVIERDRKRRKKQRKEEKRRKKAEKQLAKWEKEEKEREEKQKNKRRSVDETEIPQLPLADEDDVGHATASSSVTKKPHRLNKIVPVSDAEARSDDVVCLSSLPEASEFVPKQKRRVYSEYWQKNSLARTGMRKQLQLREILCLIPRFVVNDAGQIVISSRNSSEGADERPVVEQALVLWQGSHEVEVLELELLKEYYPRKLFEAFMNLPIERKKK